MTIDETRRQAYTRKYREIVKRARLDPELYRRLVANPAAVLQEHGIEVPASAEIRVIDLDENVEPIERGGNVRYLVLPPGPPRGERSGKEPIQLYGGTDILVDDWVSVLLGEAGGGVDQLVDEELAQVAAAGWLEMGEIRDVTPRPTWLQMGEIIDISGGGGGGCWVKVGDIEIIRRVN